MKNLKKLNISGECGVDESGICELDLYEINLTGNNKVKDISFMKI